MNFVIIGAGGYIAERHFSLLEILKINWLLRAILMIVLDC